MQSDDFFNAYLVLKDNNEAMIERLSNSPDRKFICTKGLGTRITGGVEIVCLAFSIELYIKDLLYAVKGKAPREHNILKLFKELPEQVRHEIFSHDSISQNPFFTRGNVMLTKRFASDFSAYDGFLEQIELISDGFEKWRYSYESKALRYDTSFALALIESIQTVSRGIKNGLINE
jgi:hypothetical protein